MKADAKVTIRRSQRPDEVAAILATDYIDPPIRWFPATLRTIVARQLLAPDPRVYFYVAEVDGRYAGFKLGQAHGPSFWRGLVRRHAWRHPWLWGRVIVQACWERLLERIDRFNAGGRQMAVPIEDPGLTGVVQLDRPFAWTTHPGVAQLEYGYICPEFRNRGLSAKLSVAMIEQFAHDGITLVESHIDGRNIASIRSAAKVGWDIYRTSDNRYYLRFETHRQLRPLM